MHENHFKYSTGSPYFKNSKSYDFNYLQDFKDKTDLRSYFFV